MNRRIVLLSLALLILFLPTHAMAKPEPVEVLLKGKLDFIFSTLMRKDIDIETKKTLITEDVSPIFDFTLMGKLTLGKKNWAGLSGKERALFIKTFTEVMKASYSDKLSLYTDEMIKIHPVQSTKKNKAVIPTELISKEKRYAMEYKLYHSKKGWKVYDITLQGVSLIATYRTQFSQVLTESGFETLISKLSEIKV